MAPAINPGGHGLNNTAHLELLSKKANVRAVYLITNAVLSISHQQEDRVLSFKWACSNNEIFSICNFFYFQLIF